MSKNTKIFISTIALISVLLVGKEVIDSSNKSKEQIEYLETKIESLENDLQAQNWNAVDEKQNTKSFETTKKDETEDLEENNSSVKQENFYDINSLRIIEKTYKDGNTKKSLVISSTTYGSSTKEFSDVQELSSVSFTKEITNFYSVFKGELLGYQERIILDNSEICVSYEKIDYDGYEIEKRIILSPDNLKSYNYEVYSDDIEIRVYTLENILDESLIKAKYTFSDILKIVVELDGKVEDKIEDLLINKLIKD